MDSNILQFPTREVVFWSDFERGLRSLCRDTRRSPAFEDELVRRLRPLVELLTDDPAEAALASPGAVALKHRLLRERFDAEVATLSLLGYS